MLGDIYNLPSLSAIVPSAVSIQSPSSHVKRKFDPSSTDTLLMETIPKMQRRSAPGPPLASIIDDEDDDEDYYYQLFGEEEEEEETPPETIVQSPTISDDVPVLPEPAEKGTGTAIAADLHSLHAKLDEAIDRQVQATDPKDTIKVIVSVKMIIQDNSEYADLQAAKDTLLSKFAEKNSKDQFQMAPIKTLMDCFLACLCISGTLSPITGLSKVTILLGSKTIEKSACCPHLVTRDIVKPLVKCYSTVPYDTYPKEHMFLLRDIVWEWIRLSSRRPKQDKVVVEIVGLEG
jgi:hypothetical protein